MIDGDNGHSSQLGLLGETVHFPSSADVLKSLLVFLCLAISVSIPQGLALLLRPLHIPCALFLVILDFGKHEHSIYPCLDQLRPPPGSLGEGDGTPLQYSCLEYFMGGGAR